MNNKATQRSIPVMDVSTPVLQVQNLVKSYGSGESTKVVLNGIDFSASAGEMLAIVGPSGVGKSTLLTCISGLASPTSGTVVFDGQPVTRSPDRLAMVFQDYSRSLLPWLSVLANVTLPLRRTVSNAAEREQRALEALASVGLEHATRLKPYQMSGGMQQRVAIARALAYRPLVLLMDEPFASVDAQTREELEDLTLQLRGHYEMTIIVVTHDIDEAVYMSDRIVVLGGRPASVRDVVPVYLGKERNQIQTKNAKIFGELRARIHEGIRG